MEKGNKDWIKGEDVKEIIFPKTKPSLMLESNDQLTEYPEILSVILSHLWFGISYLML
jgi:hypothetical protein